MKYLLSLTASLLFITISHAQNTTQVQSCVIENGILKNVTTDYDYATGDYSIKVNGVKKAFDEVYPPTGKDYAGATTWYINNEPVMLNGKKYTKYGLPRILSTTDIQKTTEYKKVGVYVEAGLKGVAEVIYIPSRRGCEFQPYLMYVSKAGNHKIYYDQNWQKTTTAGNAAYYRVVTTDEDGKPVGIVRDYYITGEKQWEGNISYMDSYDNNKDIIEGVATWFHKNGKKSAQVTMVQGQAQGIYKFWYEDGTIQEEAEYKDGVLHGNRKLYTTSGKLSKTEHYTNGQLDSK